MRGLNSWSPPHCQGGLSLANRRMIVDFAARHRLPAVYQATLFAEAGGHDPLPEKIHPPQRCATDCDHARTIAQARERSYAVNRRHEIEPQAIVVA